MTDSATLRAKLISSSNPALRRILTQKLIVNNLKTRIEACRNCSLGSQRSQSVPLDGPTHGRADLIIVGEAPGFYEDKSGVPFVGASGRFLDKTLKKAGTSRSKVVVLNTLCCRPPNNRDPSPDELGACRPNFDAQLKLTGLWIGVALGGYALANIMGVARSSIRISDYLDKPVWKDGRVWFGTYHPAYALRNIDARREIALSFRAAMSLRYASDLLPPFSYVGKSKTKERDAEVIEKLTELEILGNTREDLARHLHKKGWAFGKSEGLGAQILIIGNEDVPIKQHIPPALLKYPTYTLDELLRIGEAGKGKGGWGKAEMRVLHMVREEFGGEIVA